MTFRVIKVFHYINAFGVLPAQVEVDAEAFTSLFSTEENVRATLQRVVRTSFAQAGHLDIQAWPL